MSSGSSATAVSGDAEQSVSEFDDFGTLKRLFEKSANVRSRLQCAYSIESVPDDSLQITSYDENTVNSQGTSDWPAPVLTFHQVHGSNIQILKGGRVAKRKESFCKGLAFSSRPISVDENVCIKFAEVVSNWSGVLRFGVTNVDPDTYRGVTLPKFACPDLTTKEGYWAKALPERYSVAGSILHFYVNNDGELYYGINGILKGQFLNGINIHAPLWVIVDIYGNSSSLEFIDPNEVRFRSNHPSNRSRGGVRKLSSTSATQVTTTGTNSSSGTQAHQRQGRGSSTSRQNLPLSTYHAGVQFSPLTFHSVRGKHISLSYGYTMAERHSGEYACGYVFTSRPLAINEKIVLQILDVEPAYTGSMAFGLTCCDPVTLQGSTLPVDSDDLLERGEYWVSIKDVAAQPKITDELSFWINDQGHAAAEVSGGVYFAKNNLAPRIIIHVDISVKLWAFFDVYGTTQRIRLLGSVKVNGNMSSIEPFAHSSSNMQAPQSLLDLSPQSRIEIGTSTIETMALPVTTVSETERVGDNFQSLLARRTHSDTSTGDNISLSFGRLSTSQTDRSSSLTPIGIRMPRLGHSVDGGNISLNPGLAIDATRWRGSDLQSSSNSALDTTRWRGNDPQSFGNLIPPPVPARFTTRNTQGKPMCHPSSASSLLSLQNQYQQQTEEAELSDECRICMNAKVNCVIYTCGHMSMCFECATETWHVNGECPICRRKIEDVIKTYKS